MTLDQILAVLAIVVPLISTMLGMHIQNLVRGDRLMQSVRQLQLDFLDHNRRVKKMRRRLDRIAAKLHNSGDVK